MDHSATALLALLIVFVAAQIGAEIAQRFKLPSVVGEIAAGCIVGPFAELGAVLLLFSVGLETRLADLKKVGKVAAYVGTAGVIVPFVVGGLWAYLAGYETPKAMFIGAAFVATSAGITARVLHELGMLTRIESRIILGAAVIDDILAMLLLGVVTSFQSKGTVDVTSLLLVLLQASAFVGLLAVVGTKLMRRSSDLLEAPINPLSPLTLCLAGCLALAVAAAYVGLAAIIGAFLAGMIAAESRQRHSLEKQIQPIMAFLVPYFFVVTGAKVDLSQLASPAVVAMVLLVTVLAVASKLIACGLGAISLGRRSGLIVGVGMVPRGEVGIIVASLGLQAGVFSNTIYSVIILMSLLTSVIAPPVLKTLFAGIPRSADDSGEDHGHLVKVDTSGHG
jgi:Kef-type K+ transport system membrane component KefB